MVNSVLRTVADVTYRLGIGPRPSDVPDHRLVEVVEGPDRLAAGRAVDLGSGTGRNAIYLARHGWDVVGVEMSGYAVEVSRRRATEQGAPARFVQGDVTKLPDLDIGAAFNLFMDGGCYHTLPPGRRDAFGESVTAVAAPGARLIMIGFRQSLSAGTQGDGLLKRLPGWRLLSEDRVPRQEMHEYVSGPAPLKALLKRGALHPMRYELEYTPDF
jgi:SAM-dependent methyltransferase